MAEYLEWVNHKGKRMLHVKFVGLKDEKPYLQAIADLEAEILRQPRGQFVPLLMDVSDTRVTKAVADRGKQLMESTKQKGVPDSPIAIVGLSGAQKAIVLALQVIRPDIHVAKNVDEAKDWLAKQLK